MSSSSDGAVPPSLSTRSFAYIELKGRVIQGEIPPGARISERSLSQALGVSRTPLREALLQLESEKLVERTESGGWQVPRLSERAVRDIFSVRKQLEVLAVRLSIERASDSEVAGLESFLEASETAFAVNDIVSMTGANGEFHTAVYRSAHSPWLETTMAPVRNQTIRIRSLIAGNAKPEYSEGHRQNSTRSGPATHALPRRSCTTTWTRTCTSRSGTWTCWRVRVAPSDTPTI